MADLVKRTRTPVDDIVLNSGPDVRVRLSGRDPSVQRLFGSLIADALEEQADPDCSDVAAELRQTLRRGTH